MYKQGCDQAIDQSTTLVDLLCWRALNQPDQQAYTFLADGETEEIGLTYGELDLQARSIGAMLQSIGAAGAHVLLLYPPGLDYIAAFFGCLYAGCVAVPSYPPRLNRPDARLKAIVADAQATVVLTTPQILSSLQSRFEHTPELQTMRWLVTDNLDSNLADEWRDPGVDGETLAFLQYTSGSTSAPKGVMVSHNNILYNEHMIQQAFGHTSQSIAAGWLPLYHDMGLIGNVLQPLYIGAPCILMSPVDFLQKPIRWLQAISRYKVHSSGGPNFAYELCVHKITPEQSADLDLSSWKVAFNGAEPVRYQTMERFAAAFEPCGFRREAFYPCYGLAEATLFVAGGLYSAPPVLHAVKSSELARDRVVVASQEDDDARVLVSCGRTWAAQEIAIVHPETLKKCPAGRVGEIWISGRNAAHGYWGKPEESKHTFRSHLADAGEGPFLRTGDLGTLIDGELFVTGRIKDLIIIRGHNYYPQDLELTAVQSHAALQLDGGAAFSIDVQGQERLVIVQELKRTHRNADIDEVARAIRQAVAEEHALRVYAVVLIRPMSLPKTSSGKIQRHVCRAKFLEGSLEVIRSSILDNTDNATGDRDEGISIRQALLAVEAAGERHILLQRYLSEQAAQVLGFAPSQLDLQQPLIALGLDSLMAIDLQNRIEAGLGVTLPAVSFLDGLSVAQGMAQIARELESGGGRQHEPLEITLRQGDLPLSVEQERLWLLDQLMPGNPAYHIGTAIRIKGRIDVMALERAFAVVIRRHEALRTVFPTTDGKPAQVIAPALSVPLSIIDLRPLAETMRACEAQRLAAAEVRAPFSLAQGSLVRATLLQLGAEEHLAILVMHHIVSDIWSMGVLLRELAASYAALVSGETSSLPELPVQYVDFASWQRAGLAGERLKEQISYWKGQLADAPPMLELPTDRPRPAAQSFRGAHHSFELPPHLVEALRDLSRDRGVTLFMTLLAALKVLLCRYTGQEDIVVGSPTSGRVHPNTEALIGFLAYPLVLRTDVSGDPSFQELLNRIRRVVLGAYAHSEVPFSKVVETVRPKRNANYTPLFRVMFSLARSPLEGITIPGLTLGLVDVESGATDIDLFLTLIEEGVSVRGVLGYSTDLFEADTIERLAGFYSDILKHCIEQPETRLSQFELPRELEGKTPQTIAITATFTAEPVEESIAFWVKKLDMSARIVFAPYNQVFQQLLDPSSQLSKNEHGLNVVLVRFEDWQRLDGSGAAYEQIERNVNDLVAALRSGAERSAVAYLVCICPISPCAAGSDRATFFKQMEERLVSELEAVSGVYVVTGAELAACYPVATTYDADADEMGHIPYTPAFFTALGTMIVRKMHAIQRAPYKVIVLDCDETLWKGVCGEDGPLGVEIDQPRKALQEFMVAQCDAGMLLCLCSKNDEADVVEVLERHPEMVLRSEHIVARRINWRPKPENIRSLAEELQLGLDSFIFLDDNPVECAEVQAGCPEVLTLQLPEGDNIARFLNHVWAFDHVKITEADQQRAVFYRQDMERKHLQRESPSFEDFLAGLELEVEISELAPEDVARAAQLTQRTNQFNCTTIRRAESEIQSRCLAGELECLVVHVRDRFGDYGLVGLMMFTPGSDAIHVDTFLLSCRALGRRVEHHMMARLGEVAAARGLDHVDVLYVPSQKNQPALDFLESLGAQFERPHGDSRLFRFPVEHAAKSLAVEGLAR